LSTASTVVGDAKEELEIEYNGPELAIGFNSTYFLESLQSAESEMVNLFFEHELSPGIVKFSNVPDYLNVVMPIRI
jgi:DNA polymerase-3 subunit beta